MIGELMPSRIIAPGRILESELEARGWTQKDLADIMKRPVQAINEITRATKQITPETAVELAAAFGTSAEFWTNLEANYRLALAKAELDQKKQSRDIERRSALYTAAPIAELKKNRWILASADIDELEREVYSFLNIENLQQMPERLAACRFRHTRTREPSSNAQYAWIMRVRQLAAVQRVPPFRPEKLQAVVNDLLQLTENVRDVVQVPTLLLNAGMHFVIVPHLQKTYLDGAAFYFQDHPAIALTLRHDRLDSFWFTLMHELAHIVLLHVDSSRSQGGDIFLDNLEPESNEVEGQEAEANEQAGEWLLDSSAFDVFLARGGSDISLRAIQLFAKEQRRHPSIVLGKLQHRRVLDYARHRALVAKVRPYLRDWLDVSGAEQ